MFTIEFHIVFFVDQQIDSVIYDLVKDCDSEDWNFRAREVKEIGVMIWVTMSAFVLYIENI